VNGDLASLLAAGERAAFHGPPGAAVADLEKAVVIAQREGRRAEVTAAAWLLGVALSAGGRYGGALRVLMPLVQAGESGESAAETRLFAALAAATAASVQRGLGRHEHARALDQRGLSLAEGQAEALFDAWLGLVSDAVGMQEVPAAQAALGEAEALVAAHDEGWWRQRVRLGWAKAEVALLQDQPEEASVLAANSVEEAERARAPRHVSKGLLFQGVAELSAGSPEAPATLRRAATLAEGLSGRARRRQCPGRVRAVAGGGSLRGARHRGGSAGRPARGLAGAAQRERPAGGLTAGPGFRTCPHADSQPRRH
jgi:hypothetical protein